MIGISCRGSSETHRGCLILTIGPCATGPLSAEPSHTSSTMEYPFHPSGKEKQKPYCAFLYVIDGAALVWWVGVCWLGESLVCPCGWACSCDMGYSPATPTRTADAIKRRTALMIVQIAFGSVMQPDLRPGIKDQKIRYTQ